MRKELWGVKVLESDLRKAFTTEVTENTEENLGPQNSRDRCWVKQRRATKDTKDHEGKG
jgi:hypothetical protein